MNLRLSRSLIRRADTSKLLDNPLTSLLIKSLRITLLRNLNRNINVDLNERKTGIFTGGRSLVKSTSRVPILLVRGNERSNSDTSAISEELGDFTDTTNVLVTVILAESEILVQTETDVVTVQTVGVDIAGKQLTL